MKNQPIIIGIDPGTTTAYAILDLSGNILALKSSKQLKSSELIFDILNYGSAVIVASDVNPAGSLAKKIANKTGARLIKPDSALRVKDKKRLTSKLEYGNLHERDALAAAIYSFKRVRALLAKVDKFSKTNNSSIKSLVLRDHNISIDRAIKLAKNQT